MKRLFESFRSQRSQETVLKYDGITIILKIRNVVFNEEPSPGNVKCDKECTALTDCIISTIVKGNYLDLHNNLSFAVTNSIVDTIIDRINKKTLDICNNKINLGCAGMDVFHKIFTRFCEKTGVVVTSDTISDRGSVRGKEDIGNKYKLLSSE